MMTDAAHSMEPRRFSLGLGLTNECNLSCSFCYRDPTRTDRLDLADVESVLDRLPVRTVNLGTGENGMHPDFARILEHLRARDTKVTITSNGYSIAVLSDEQLKAFNEVEFSLDYPSRAEQDEQRGAGNWNLVHEQARRCRDAGIGVTIIAVLMRTNFDRLADIAAVAKVFDAPLRINVYQAVRSDIFALTYEEYWTAFKNLFAATDVIAIGEPLVRAMAGLPPRAGGCGVSTVRITPRGTVQPCVYWQPFVQARSVPEACLPCEFRATCGGGCAGRRRLMRQLDKPDPYCPVLRGETRHLEVRFAPSRELGKLESACTTIVVAR
jgi:MoaA/NifB/PqqE/SkfB family radical SAM enzyme